MMKDTKQFFWQRLEQVARIPVVLLVFLACLAPLVAQEDLEESKEEISREEMHEKSIEKSRRERRTFPSTFETDVTVMGIYPWGFVLEAGESLEVPLLRGENSLTAMNALKFRGGVKFTPIMLEADFKASFTPIAFLQVFAGGGIGSGWSFSKFHGFAKNIDGGDGKSKKIPINMKDFFFNTRFGLTFQFDLGAVLKHEWAHVVFLTDQGMKYFGAANMTSYDSWVYAEDYGESRNSWHYASRYVLGYQMPIPLTFVGVQVEAEKKLYRQPENKADWGDDLMYAYITPLLVFRATKYLNIVVATQLFTRKNYEKSDDVFYEKNRIREDGPAQRVEFKRFAVSCVFTLKH